MLMNKRGGLTDLFLFAIVSFVIVLISAIFIYIGGIVNTELQASIGQMTFGESNGSVIVDETMGQVSRTYDALYWISIFLILGMAMSIFIGSYLVTTRPIFFIPYIFILIIAVIVSVGISLGYEQIIATPELASTFEGFVGANFILSKLPMWISIIGVVGGIIMFARMGSRENEVYGGGYVG